MTHDKKGEHLGGFMRFLFQLLVSLTVLTACSDLSVFTPPPRVSNLAGVSSVEIDEDGKLALSWTLKSGSIQGRKYDAYLLELKPDDTQYVFSDEKIQIAPLTSESIKVPLEESPLKIGTLAASASELSLSLPEILKPDRKYLLQLVEKRGIARGEQTVLLLKVDFKTDVPGSARTSADKITITWTSVPGANNYEVYADEKMTLLLGKSSSNELTLDKQAATSYKTFFVRPLRGILASKDVFRIELSDSDARIVNVKSTKADGLYTINQILDFEVTFSQAVSVFGDAALVLRMDNVSQKADYFSGSGSTTLKFRYKIKAGDDTSELDNETVLDGAFTDASGLAIAAAVPPVGAGATLAENSSISIDATEPTHHLPFLGLTLLRLPAEPSTYPGVQALTFTSTNTQSNSAVAPIVLPLAKAKP